jgi:kynurenine formamidase
MHPTRSLTEEFAKLSNWGRWGPMDERGTLNLLTNRTRAAAAALVTDGSCVSCARPMKPRRSSGNYLHHMTGSGEGAPTQGFGSAGDWVGITIHGLEHTHLDSPAHISWDGNLYNGADARKISTRRGALVGSADLAVDGIIGRGILLDGAAISNKSWMQRGDRIEGRDIEAWFRQHDIVPRSGDILVVRFGRDAAEKDHVDLLQLGTPCLGINALSWIRDHDISVVASDLVCDEVSTAESLGDKHCPLPIHMLALVSMGLWLIDNAELGELAEACRAKSRYDFLFAAVPLALKNSTGSPVNPIAIF